MENTGFEHTSGFAKRDERGGAELQSTLDGLQGRGLLQAAQTRNRGVEEVEEQEADVLVAEQPTVAGRVACGAEVSQPPQQGREGIEVLQTLKIARFDPPPSLCRQRCLLPSRQSPETHEKMAQISCQMAWRKTRAEQY
jgi:hypothetical protein